MGVVVRGRVWKVLGEEEEVCDREVVAVTVDARTGVLVGRDDGQKPAGTGARNLDMRRMVGWAGTAVFELAAR